MLYDTILYSVMTIVFDSDLPIKASLSIHSIEIEKLILASGLTFKKWL